MIHYDSNTQLGGPFDVDSSAIHDDVNAQVGSLLDVDPPVH